MTKPLAEMTIEELLTDYAWSCRYDCRNEMLEVQAELERRTTPAPVATTKPVRDMTLRELFTEDIGFHRETRDMKPRHDLVVEELSRRYKASEELYLCSEEENMN